MKRGTDVRMWLCGTECQLRPVNAVSLLSAKKESREITEEFSGDDNDEKLIKAACIVAAGAYDNNEKMFVSGKDVLEKLTAGEIFSAASEYETTWDVIEKQAAVNIAGENSEIKKVDGADLEIQTADKSELTEQTAEYKRDFDKSTLPEENAALKNEKNTEESSSVKKTGSYVESVIEKEKKPGVKSERSAILKITENLGEKEDKALNRTKMVAPGRTEPAVREITNDSGENIRKIALSRAGRDNMASVSNFFERDCRRYDGAFTRY